MLTSNPRMRFAKNWLTSLMSNHSIQAIIMLLRAIGFNVIAGEVAFGQPTGSLAVMHLIPLEAIGTDRAIQHLK